MKKQTNSSQCSDKGSFQVTCCKHYVDYYGGISNSNDIRLNFRLADVDFGIGVIFGGKQSEKQASLFLGNKMLE